MKNSKLIRDTPDALTAAVSYLGSLVTKGYEVVALKELRETFEAYIIKWITSGEPPVGLKSQQDSK